MKDQHQLAMKQLAQQATWMEKTGGYVKDMTLRDHFAGQVAIGLMSEYWNSDSRTDPSFQNIARQAYWLADAMLEERNK